MDAPAGTLSDADLLLVGTADWIEPLGEAIEERSAATVRTVATEAGALEAVRRESPDGVLTGHELSEGSGVALARRLRRESTTLPIVLCTASGSETLASEALAAGVTDYVPIDESVEPTVVEGLVDRLGSAIEEARQIGAWREKAGQFDAVFRDSRTATWVLESDGTVRRANETARDLAGDAAKAPTGTRFAALALWAHDDQVQADVRAAVRQAGEGASQQFVTHGRGDGHERTLELSIQPVPEGSGDRALVVEAVDVTDRVALHRELRRSERLHRVTLNNMTDTVLVTDESGAFTYVCPNVHFIFGYSAAEIEALGTIDALLGEDLVDDDRLAAEGVVTNVETTATDKHGREHTLLVNVRSVDIQGGTRLYSCRDVTTRKQREDALRTLHTTSRNLLYAEHASEIARTIVDDTADVLDLDMSAVYLFRDDDTVLEPVASTDAMTATHGPLEPHATGAETIVSHSFLDGERHFFEDVRSAERLDNPSTGLRSAAYIPLGEHGVYVVGSTEPGVFDSLHRELADLVAATAEAALDRVERESRLLTQERELQRRNEELVALNELNELIREIDRAIVGAETREEIDHAVCEALTDGDRFEFAWIGDVDDVAGTVEPRAWAGTEDGYLESIDRSLDGEMGDPTVRTARSGSHTLVSGVAGDLRAGSWRKAAIARGFQSVCSVPLGDDGFTHGVLTVYADEPGAIDDKVSVLAELGETIAAAITGLERRNALLSAAVTRLEFETDDPEFPLLALCRRGDCALSIAGGVQQTESGVSVIATVTDGTATDVLAAAEAVPAITEARTVAERADKAILQLTVARPFFVLPLADHGATLGRMDIDGESATIVVDVPERTDTRQVTAFLRERFADVTLLAKRTAERTPGQALYATFLDRLTDRQLEVVRTAYYAGYYESPRDTSGEELADALDISPPAFYRHTRIAERKLFETLFEDVGLPASAEG